MIAAVLSCSTTRVLQEDQYRLADNDIKVLNDPNPPVTRLRLKGLEAGAQYRDASTGKVYSANALMNAGLNMPQMRQDFDSVRIVLEKI